MPSLEASAVYTVHQIAKLCCVSADDIRRHVAQGNFTVRYPTGRAIFGVDDLRVSFKSLPIKSV